MIFRSDRRRRVSPQARSNSNQSLAVRATRRPGNPSAAEGPHGRWLVLAGAGLLALAARGASQEPPAESATLSDSALRALTISAGYVAPEASLEDDGIVLGSNTEGDIAERSLTPFDVVRMDPTFDGRAAAVGDTLLVYRDGGDLQAPSTGEALGTIVYPTGLAVVVATSNESASARVVRGFDAVQAGQRVQFLKPGESWMPAGEQVRGEGRVVGLRDKVAVVTPFSVVYLDLPPGSDLRPGDEVELVRPDSRGGRELPDIRIGSARVLDVGAAAATAIVIALDRSDLEVGDSYRPARGS